MCRPDLQVGRLDDVRRAPHPLGPPLASAPAMLPTRMRRVDGCSYIGPRRYSLTLCTLDRTCFFADADLVDIVRTQIRAAAAASGFDVIAYCFMPDHLHMFVHAVTPAASLIEFVKHAKQRSGYHGKRKAGRKIWQSGYHERVLRETEDDRAVVAYIVGNPVRAGLVSDPATYPFSGSGPYGMAELMAYVQTRDGPT